jgi:Asp-tRNA(Asn)/Glu-tRNA(Gln) amidotransferase A subunit family amidase
VAEVDETTYPLATGSRAVNYLGACAISIPLTLSRAGLPIGLQLVGAAGDEDVLCRIAFAATDGDRAWVLGPARRPGAAA